MTEITRDSLTADLQRLADDAEAAKDFSAAVDAIMVIAKLHGLIVEHRIVEHVGRSQEEPGAALLRWSAQRLRVVE